MKRSRATARRGEAAAKRWIKERVYNRLPFWLGPFGYFLYRYFVQFGFSTGERARLPFPSRLLVPLLWSARKCWSSIAR